MKLNLDDKEVKKALGTKFYGYAALAKISITPEDIAYVNNIIKQDRCYKLIEEPPLIKDSFDATESSERELESRERELKIQESYSLMNKVVFYEKFYYDANCPFGIKNILFIYIGTLRNFLSQFAPHILEHRYHYIEQWLNTNSY